MKENAEKAMIEGLQKQQERYQNRMKVAIRKFLEKRVKEARIKTAQEAALLI